MKCIAFLQVNNVQKKMHNIDKFLRPFCINSYFVKKICSRYFMDDLFKILRQMLGKIICLMEVKNHINNTLVTAKRWPRPLNRGGR